MRQLSFAFLQDRQHIAGCLDIAADGRTVTLRRIDPAQNMARFYALEVERDLFGRIVLARRWGRIGTGGKVRLEGYTGEGEAMAALLALEAAKRRRGYQLVPSSVRGP